KSSSRLRLLWPQGVVQSGEVRGLDLQMIDTANLGHPVDTVVQALRRWAGGAFTVGVVNAAMARAQEQARLLEPRHGTAQVRAVDSQNQELVSLGLVRFLLVLTLIAHEDARAGNDPIPRLADGVVEIDDARLVQRKLRHRAQRHPLLRRFPRSEKV